MKTLRILTLVFATIGLLGLMSCSTPEARISKNPEMFARLTPAQQEMIKKGEVGVGFDQEMVKLALGQPDRIVSRTDVNGTGEVWSYITYEAPDGFILYRGWYHRYYGWGDPLYPYYMSYPGRRERDHLRIVFDTAGRVTSIEKEQ